MASRSVDWRQFVFVPRAGKLFVGLDYSAVEMRLAAEINKDSESVAPPVVAGEDKSP